MVVGLAVVDEILVEAEEVEVSMGEAAWGEERERSTAVSERSYCVEEQVEEGHL